MKFVTVSQSLVLGLALLLASSALAATKGSLQLSNPVTVNGTTLKAGDYKVQWEGAGPKARRTLVPPSPETIKAIHDVVAGIVGFTDQRGDQVDQAL